LSAVEAKIIFIGPPATCTPCTPLVPKVGVGHYPQHSPVAPPMVKALEHSDSGKTIQIDSTI